MNRSLIILPDGTEIFSGKGTENAILSRSITQLSNSGTDLTLGAVCSAMLEMKLFTLSGKLTIEAGTEIELYEVDDSLARSKVGVFICEKPTRTSPNRYSVTAYDRVTKLDKNLTEWLSALDAWPYTLRNFTGMVCAECGLTFKNESIPNGDTLIYKFLLDSVKGRELMQKIGEVCCRYGRATPDGEFEFAWYSDSGKSLTTSDYRENGFSYEDYVVHPIERVQIKQTEDDMGVIYPENSDGDNTYIIAGNYLIPSQSIDYLMPIAQTIYQELENVSYTPGKCVLFAPSGVELGDIVAVTDKNGNRVQMYVMASSVSGQRETIECFGSYRRDSVTHQYSESFAQVANRKMLELTKSIDGLTVRSSELQEQVNANQESTERMVSEVSVKSDGISAEVSQQTQNVENLRQEIASVQMSASEVAIRIQNIEDNGVLKVKTRMGYTFDDEGLNVHKEGDEVDSQLTNRGLYVGRGDDDVLVADAAGVKAIDITVVNFFKIGNSRFEKYNNGTDSKRTAIFFVEE